LEVLSIKSLLASCNLSSCKEFADRSVFSGNFDSTWFWQSYNTVKFDEKKRIVFLWMVKATHKHALEQSADQMIISLRNLEADPSKCCGNLLCAVLSRIFELFSVNSGVCPRIIRRAKENVRPIIPVVPICRIQRPMTVNETRRRQNMRKVKKNQAKYYLDLIFGNWY
jgi:hypothetical protein